MKYHQAAVKEKLKVNLESSPDKQRTLLIWDAQGLPSVGDWTTILWSNFGDSDDQRVISMPKLVEEQATTLRSRFLAYIYTIGNAQIKGKRLVDQLQLRSGFSYWWMTLIVEKSNAYKSRQITDVLKLLILEDLLKSRLLSTVILVSRNNKLAQTLRIWCKNSGLVFKRWKLQGRKKPDSWIRMVYRSLPQSAQAILWLMRYLWQRWPLRQWNDYQNAADNAEITFVDYLINLDQKVLTTGKFASNFWTDLIDALDRSGSKVNWLHHYIPHEAVSSAQQARDLIARLNQSAKGRQFHTCLDSALSISLLLAVLRNYVRLVWMNVRLTKIRHHFRPVGAMLDLWPLFKKDWRISMLGPDAIWNCLVLNLFERTLSRLPRQKLGIYLQENQGWEMALIYAWRAAGHGQLIGVPHSTVRYWDLRYYFDHRNYQRINKNDFPMPDKVALNGPAALAAYLQDGYPADQLAEVEALRYMYLADHVATQIKEKVTVESSLKVLILGDYLPDVTKRQLKWLVEAAPLLPPETRFTVKPHPACPVLPKDYPSLQLHVVSTPLPKLLTDCDVVFTSNITSAAVDAYCAGAPVVSVLEGETINMSPLRGLSGVVYVTNPAELVDALRTAQSRTGVIDKPFFYLDKGLPRWQKLLNLNLVDTEQ